MINRTWIISLICIIVALIFVFIALFGTWWRIESESEQESYFYGNYYYYKTDSSAKFKLTSLEEEYITYQDESKYKETNTSKYSDEENKDVLENVRKTFNMTFYLVLGATIFSLIFLFFIIIFGLDIYKIDKNIIKIVGFLAVIFCFIAPILLYVMLPNAMENDWGKKIYVREGKEKPGYTQSFWGSESENIDLNTYKTSWGAGFGWFSALIAGIFNIIGLVAVFFYKVENRQYHLQSQIHTIPYYQYPNQKPYQKYIQQYPNQQPYPPQEVHQPPPPPIHQPLIQMCPFCRQPLRYIQQYQAWYCETCQRYV